MAGADQPRARIRLISLGGTIAMAGKGKGGVAPSFEAPDLLGAVPGLEAVAAAEAVSFRNLPSAHLGVEDVFELAGEVRRCFDEGVEGIVVTQGTDTLEETAFLLDLVLEDARPVVLTGAMRNPTLPGADGPANLAAAFAVAAEPSSAGRGVLVVMDDQVHAARFVTKAATQGPGAFRSAPGPVGLVAEGRPVFFTAPLGRPHLPPPRRGATEQVALLTHVLGDDGSLVAAAAETGIAGLVFEAAGGGHVSPAVADALERLSARIPVVLASRTGSGMLLRSSYGFVGSERDLVRRGLIGAGWLPGRKARLLLLVLLRAGAAVDAIRAAFEAPYGDLAGRS